jgi:hypothetical protein
VQIVAPVSMDSVETVIELRDISDVKLVPRSVSEKSNQPAGCRQKNSSEKFGKAEDVSQKKLERFDGAVGRVSFDLTLQVH